MNIKKIINEEIVNVSEEYTRQEYHKWKRDNVTLRGMKDTGEDNGVWGSWGKGLYTTPLSNASMARKYGKVYFVLGAKPKHPKIVQGVNAAEILRHKLLFDYNKKNGIDQHDRRMFDKNTSMEKEMMALGYDGLFIKGREMVNYTPDNDNIMYFENERQLENYYEHISSR